MNNIIIRKYIQNDWACMCEIHDAARMNELELAGLPAAFIPLVQAAEKEGLFDYFVDVALIDNEVVGFVAYTDDELAWLYVDPQRTRQGIGKALINFVLEKTDKRQVDVEVLIGNTPAISLYETMGFKIIETCSGAMPGNETFKVTVHCMQKTC